MDYRDKVKHYYNKPTNSKYPPKPTNGDTWGRWTFNKVWNILEFTNDAGYEYEVDLDRVVPTPGGIDGVFSWIEHISNKITFDATDVGNLVYALLDITRAQARGKK